MSNRFYCYSVKMSYFIRAFGVRYIEIGVNPKSGTRYHVFEKSERLDKIISLYNSIKHTI